MINCVCSVDTRKRTECIALRWEHYLDFIRDHKCGTDKCPFYKPRKGDEKNGNTD